MAFIQIVRMLYLSSLKVYRQKIDSGRTREIVTITADVKTVHKTLTLVPR
jgi:hypothetical protein